MSALGRCGRFVLLERIGLGGMGEIFSAEEDGTGRRVAIKRLLPQCAKDPVFIGMFLDEARLAERLRHPNVCEVYEHGLEGRHYYLVMEHIDGVSLRELLDARRGRGLPFPLAARILAEAASGLDYAHRFAGEDGAPLGVVHRDVSPANIMIARDGRVKLVDFGLAKARTQIMKTQPGLVKGKFGYLAPEQLGGKIDWRTDLFALGLCAFEAVSGRQLFDQATAAETVQAIQRFRGPPPVAGIPEGMSRLLARVLSVQPAERHPSAAAFRADLAQVVIDEGIGAVSAAELAALVAAPPAPIVAAVDDDPVTPPTAPMWPLALAAAIALMLGGALALWLVFA
ncbi:MAG: serine/threonine protein kinase [Sandaracinaceae bacterium]|nr:serine/threonine protein kinase [Sandaracinaceae bacterium]